MAFWVRVGEAIGYGLAAVVLGPSEAISRRERRRIRQTFLAWCDERGSVRHEAARGMLRRTITLTTPTGTMPAEVELDPFARRARILAVIAPLPSWVRASARRDETLQVMSDSLDPASLRALRDSVLASPLGELRVIQIDLESERLEVLVIAMTTIEAWRAIGDGVVALTDWVSTRWPVGYRG